MNVAKSDMRRGLVKLPILPPHPERVCWGCEQRCPADSLACGNGTERTQHPCELFGDDWYEWAHPEPAERPLDVPDTFTVMAAAFQ